MDAKHVAGALTGGVVLAYPAYVASQVVWELVTTLLITASKICLIIISGLLVFLALPRLGVDVPWPAFMLTLFDKAEMLLRDVINKLLNKFRHKPPGQEAVDERDKPPGQEAVEKPAAVNLTVRERARGKDVVEATLDLIDGSCLFDDDKLMLRRIAFVGTNDGEDDSAFEEGGIWQIRRLLFERIKSKGLAGMRDKIEAIQQKFGIDWNTVHPEDMKKPLYCALFARMWLDLQLGNSPYSGSGIPRSADEQAEFWAKYYCPPEAPGSSSLFKQKVPDVEGDDVQVSKADVLFVLDSSGSIGASDYNLMKEFVKDIVATFNVGADEVRVGLIRYSSCSQLQFGLGAHGDFLSVLMAIDRVTHSGGGTSTHLALQNTVKEFELRGRVKAGIPQICVFMTDGQSDNRQTTLKTAQTELEAIASQPSHSHVFMLDTFADMEHFKAQLAKQTSRAAGELDPGQNASGNLVNQSYNYFKIKAGRQRGGVTIQLKMSSGCSQLFVSHTMRNPNPAAYDYILEANSFEGWKTIYIPFPKYRMSGDEAVIFLALQGTNQFEANVYTLGYKYGLEDVQNIGARSFKPNIPVAPHQQQTTTATASSPTKKQDNCSVM